MFSGYGSQALALENLGIEFVSDISEIDPYAIKAYNQIHGETHNWGDITKIDETKLPYYDLITYSSPCQDFSVAGLGKGGDKDSGTRSSLLWECERIIRAVKPKYLLMENVKNLVGEKHKHNFVCWLKTLEMMGYWNFWQVLNAKDYGVPQNRERVFVVSILGGGQYLFPNKIKLEKRLKDILESNVDEKYYLSGDCVSKMLQSSFIQERLRLQFENDISGALFARDFKCPKCIAEPLICSSRGRNPENPSDRTVGAPTEQRLEVNQTGCSNTLTSVQKDNWVIEPNVLTPKRNEYGKAVRKEYERGNFTDSRHNMTDMQPRVDGVSNTLTTVLKDNYVLEPRVMQVGNIVETDSFGGNPQCGRVYSVDGCSPTLNTMQGGGREPKIINNYRVRKLTPRECWRLMGVKDEQYDKLHDISNTQLYKMAGNSIVVDVLMGIFKNLFLSDEGTSGQLTLF